MTVLFADLVGFTARSEQLDPEDVEAILRPYHERLRGELERFGGTVEKFIGDAVMALFGAPVAHEDDPERAVRAALAIRDWIAEEGKLEARIAVNTGEALVNLGARPESGQGMAAGDVVNTTARLQAAAPVNGILVGETTYRATREAIEYRDVDAVQAKGKTNPLAVWEAVQARARVGTEAVSTLTSLVGRERELDQLRDAYDRVRQERSPQLVTIVGVPGIGKSRLVAELLAVVDADPELVFWRHGRSLPYGEGVTFWALSEMVKAQAGILETDSPQDAEGKLRLTLSDLADESEQPWLETKLRPLVGLGSDADVGGDRRSESFGAWRRFFELLAERRPLVLLFEDLHWADEGVLDFVDELGDWVEGVPLLVVCTARPEILDRRAGWGGGKRNALTISLSPLDQTETARLVAALLDRPVLSADVQAELLERAGGNPLYAEQYVRMLAEGSDRVGLELPENVQGIIAARLDSLPSEEKTLLQHAAVLGKVFWPAALRAIGGGELAEIEERLRGLARKDFVRRERRSSVAGETEYEFGHVLVRDVAYGQIPRAARGERHRLSAQWIESLGRPDDHSEMLAHHYVSALELAEAAGTDPSDLPVQARKALREAGARALALDSYAAAARYFDATSKLEGYPDPDRARALLLHGQALHALGDARRFDLLEEASAALLAKQDIDGAIEAELTLVESWWWRGERSQSALHLDRLEELVSGRVTTAAKAQATAQMARFRMLFGELEQGIALGMESLAAAEALGLDDIRAGNLITIGMARGLQGDLRGLDDLRRGLEIARSLGALIVVTRALTNLAVMYKLSGDLRQAEEFVRERLELAERLGHLSGIRFARGNVVDSHFDAGRWDEAERLADELLAESDSRSPHLQDSQALLVRALIRLARGDEAEARKDVLRAVAVGRVAQDPQSLQPALMTAAFIEAELGALDAAAVLFDEVSVESVPLVWSFFAFTAGRLGRQETVRSIAARLPNASPWEEAGVAVADERWSDAADTYDRIGDLFAMAYSRLRAAEVLVHADRRTEADVQLGAALAFWRSVGATRYIREGEALLAASA